jgi:hypothetical protein
MESPTQLERKAFTEIIWKISTILCSLRICKGRRRQDLIDQWNSDSQPVGKQGRN